MAHEISYVDDSGSEGLAHWQMLLKIKIFAEANGWTTLRYDDPTDGSPRELILKGTGLSGDEEIFIGFRTYHSVSADYYNMTLAAFTGYVSDNDWEDQPGCCDRAFCAHNQRIDYWLAVNGQRILLGLKMGPPVYELVYVGKFFPYATPSQYPYPIAVCGTLGAGMPATRFSDVTSNHSSGVKGYYSVSGVGVAGSPNGSLRAVDGTWQQFRALPWTADYNNAPDIRRDTGGNYLAMKAVLMDQPRNLLTTNGVGNVWGELDGVRYISGFDNAVENTATIDSVDYVVLQDVFRTGIGDYFMVEMD